MHAADEIESMLAVLLVATHDVAMEMLAGAKMTDTLTSAREQGALATKLLRAYAAQLEALARLRRGGEQRVIVQHVHEADGGQAAVVGAVEAGPGGVKIGEMRRIGVRAIQFFVQCSIAKKGTFQKNKGLLPKSKKSRL